MKNNHHLRIAILGAISALFLCVSCSRKDNQLVEELEKLNKITGEYLERTKNFVWEIEDDDYIDSIYNLGNILIHQIDNQQIDTSLLNHLARWAIHYKRADLPEIFSIQSSLLNDAVYRESAKQKIRLLQTTFLAERLELILLTHFQCEAIGLYPINRKQWPEFEVNKKYNLDFAIWYSSWGVPAPTAMINDDTLINKDGPIYTYIFQPTQKGKMNLQRKINVYRWGEMAEIDIHSPIEIEVK